MGLGSGCKVLVCSWCRYAAPQDWACKAGAAQVKVVWRHSASIQSQKEGCCSQSTASTLPQTWQKSKESSICLPKLAACSNMIINFLTYIIWLMFMKNHILWYIMESYLCGLKRIGKGAQTGSNFVVLPRWPAVIWGGLEVQGGGAHTWDQAQGEGCIVHTQTQQAKEDHKGLGG